MERVNWDNTLLNWENLKSGIGNPNKTFLFYMVSVIMYCISFYYLFLKHIPSENIVFIFIFVMNTIFPFIWMKDLLSIDSDSEFAHRLVLYRNIGVAIALSLQFFNLFLVVLKNQNVLKMKRQSAKEDGEKNIPHPKPNDLNTNDKGTEKADRIIAILFVTITTLIWGVVGVAFSDNKFIKPNADPGEKTPPLIGTIRWLLDQPYHFINNFEITWHGYMDRINVSPLVKAFGMYCVTFLVTFFGMFVRIPYFKHPRAHNPMDRFEIVNMITLFPPIFTRNLEHFRNLSVFFLSLLVSLSFGGIMFALKSIFKEYISKSAVICATLAGFGLFFGCFFGKRQEMFPDVFAVKNLIFFMLCALFALVGTPVVLGCAQLLLETGLLNIVQKMFIKLWCRDKSCISPPLTATLNFNHMLEISAGVVYTVLLFTMYGLGVDKKWVGNASGKSMQMFLVTLATMMFSLFTALNTKYKVSLASYELLKIALQITTLYVTPLAVVVLAIVQFIFSYNNYMKYRRFEKIKV